MSQALAGVSEKKIREIIAEYRGEVKDHACRGWHEWFRGICYAIMDAIMYSAAFVDLVIDVVATVLEKYTDVLEALRYDAMTAVKRVDEAHAYRTMSILLGVEAMVNALVDVVQMKIAGSGLDLHNVSDMVRKLVAFDDILRSVYGMKMQKTYAFWMDKLYNKLYLPYIPDPQTAISLYLQDHISRKDMEEYLLMNGIPQWVWSYLMDRVSRNPTISELVNFYQFTDVDEAWIKHMLKVNNAGDLTDVWLRYIKGVALRDELRKAEGYVKTLFAQGWISEKEINDLLWKYKARKEERDVLENVWKKLKDKELKKLYLDKHVYLLRRKRIKCKDLEDRARALYGDPAFAQAIAMRECAYLGYDYPTEDVQA